MKRNIQLSVTGKTITKPRRKRGEHRFSAADFPRCVTCGCDEDDAFVGGQECTFGQTEKGLAVISEDQRRDEKRGLYPDKVDIAN